MFVGLARNMLSTLPYRHQIAGAPPGADRYPSQPTAQRRARTYGQANQHIDMLFLGVARNTLSELHHRECLAIEQASSATG